MAEKGKKQEAPVTEEEGRQFEENLQAMADDWRSVLSQPEMQDLVKRGKVKINPLVEELLEIFPPRPKSSGPN